MEEKNKKTTTSKQKNVKTLRSLQVKKHKNIIKAHRKRCQQQYFHSTTIFIQFSLPISNNKSHSMAKEKADSFSEAATQTERVTVVLGLC